MKTIKIAIVECHEIMCTALELLVNNFSDMKVVHSSCSGKLFIDYVNSNNSQPDILLMEINFHDLNAIEILNYINSNYPQIKPIIFSKYNENDYILRSIELGAVSYIPKTANLNEFELTIRKVYKDGKYFNTDIVRIMVDRIRNKKRKKVLLEFEKENYTFDELKFLEMLSLNKSFEEIHLELSISKSTFSKLKSTLFKKTKTFSISEMLTFASKNRIIQT